MSQETITGIIRDQLVSNRMYSLVRPTTVHMNQKTVDALDREVQSMPWSMPTDDPVRMVFGLRVVLDADIPDYQVSIRC